MHISRDQIQLNTFSCPVSTYTLGKSKNVHVELNQFFFIHLVETGQRKKGGKISCYCVRWSHGQMNKMVFDQKETKMNPVSPF